MVTDYHPNQVLESPWPHCCGIALRASDRPSHVSSPSEVEPMDEVAWEVTSPSQASTTCPSESSTHDETTSGFSTPSESCTKSRKHGPLSYGRSSTGKRNNRKPLSAPTLRRDPSAASKLEILKVWESAAREESRNSAAELHPTTKRSLAPRPP